MLLGLKKKSNKEKIFYLVNFRSFYFWLLFVIGEGFIFVEIYFFYFEVVF